MTSRILGIAIICASLAACSSAPPPRYSSGPTSAPSAARCYDCGTVVRIETVYGARQNTRTGAVLGGIVGGVVGNQVGQGDGKKAATVAGVVGGAVAGNAIENKMNEQTYDISIRMSDGSTVVINRNSLGSLHVGSAVRVSSGRIISE